MKVFVPSLVVALTTTFSHAADAHGPTRQKVEESIVINAPAAKVWAMVGDFNGLPKWVPPVEASSATARRDGARRGMVGDLGH